MNMTRFINTLGLATCLASVGFGALPAHAKGKVESKLTAVADADAGGRIRMGLRNASDGRFEVRAFKLDPAASFDLIVAGVKVATFTSSANGKIQARFRSRPRGRDQLLGFDPRGAFVVLRGVNGQDVLVGTLPEAITSGSASNGSADDGDVICCEPDDDGTECEDRTPEECTARGGVVSSATSCLPNPCAGSLPPTENDVVCCIPDDSGPECEDRTSSECAAQGGVVVSATSCVDNPCAGTPAADPDIMCCLPDDSGAECEDRTEAQCSALGGISKGAGVCAVDTCADTAPVGDDIMCCQAHDGGFECEDRTAAECAERGGVSKGAGVCSATTCTDVEGAPVSTDDQGKRSDR